MHCFVSVATLGNDEPSKVLLTSWLSLISLIICIVPLLFGRCNVGGGVDPKIRQIQVKTNTKIWCNYNNDTYYHIAGRGRPNEWTKYVWPAKYDVVFSDKQGKGKVQK